MVLLEHCYQLMDKEGYEINNLDSIIMCEAPKMAPHIQKWEKMSQVNYIVTSAKLTLKQHVEKNLVLSADKKEW